MATPVDTFVLSRLEAAGGGPGSRRGLDGVWVRRVHLDVLGLPPDPADVDRFLADRRPGAWTRLVDRVLADPRYGERWGRYWLDVAGYVDIIGADNDPGGIKLAPGVWGYRDYVVRAYNADKPFDDSGSSRWPVTNWPTGGNADRLPRTSSSNWCHRIPAAARDSTSSPELNTADIRHQVLYETLQTVSTSCWD
ncbi:MAG: hypothetical protein Ct9H300mP1_34250 [Planctomycetaceae bacterium]|nr:MAG: hypothetical protein Ct9H300mP1_34250 [Planctomycetaceae bacterium]